MMDSSLVVEDVHKAIWDSNAACWDEAIGDKGNSFYRNLVAPTADNLLLVQESENILELACGNGIYARRLCARGARVLATDFAPEMIARAKARSRPEELKRIFFMPLDITKEKELDGLVALSAKHCGFDAVVCNMALMDVSTLDPLAAALPRLLRQSGRFVATIMHPAFNSMGAERYAHPVEEIDPETGVLYHEKLYCVNVSQYLGIPPTRGEAISGQTMEQYYFHRPLSEIFRPFFAHGLVLDGLEEPSFPRCASKPAKEFSWQNFNQIPPVLGFRLRKGPDLD